MHRPFENPERVVDDVFGEKGFSLRLGLSDTELDTMRSVVHAQYVELISFYCPHIDPCLISAGPSMYHHIDSGVKHKIIFSKANRMLSKYLNVFQELDFYYKLRSIFGKIILAGEDIIIPEEFYWRLVRPNNPSDVGPLHADAWFWDLRQEKPPINKVRVKVWIPLYSEPGISGLKYSEGSHRKNYPYIGEMRDGMTKPLPCFNINEVPATTFDGKPGQAIIFNDYLLHGGIVGGTLTRVSIEFYILAETTTIQNRLKSNPN